MKSIAEVSNNNIAFEREFVEELPNMTVYRLNGNGSVSEQRYRGGVRVGEMVCACAGTKKGKSVYSEEGEL